MTQLFAEDLINAIKDVSGLPIKIYHDGYIYDFEIDILHNNRIDLNLLEYTAEQAED
jgi:hypothetical protein